MRWNILRGASRVVLLTGRYAIKFPACTDWGWGRWYTFLCGLQANVQEARLFRVLSGHGDQRLCPILFSAPLGVLLVMPRCRTLTQPLSDEEFQGFINGDCTVPSENKADSFGWHQGRLVSVDYA